ncbi:MAG: GIY-YIG nuclease family protein [Waterburya sp.]
MLADKFILDLECVELQNKELLPDYSGIYYVIDRQHLIWYIGRSVNLQQRWNSVENPHHRYHQLLTIATQKNTEFFIYYSQEQKNKLNKLERAHISKYQPCLNYTPVLKNKYFNSNSARNYKLKKSSYSKSYFNTSLKILSDIKKYNNKSMQKTINNTQRVVENLLNNNSSLEHFKRKFITIKNNDLKLNLELEICIDAQNKLFVRHYTYYIFSFRRINIYNLKDKDEVKDCLSTLESHCEDLYEHSLRWLGYKLSCKNVLIIDEEEQFEIETLAIMLPFRMFVELIEYQWMMDNSLSEDLENQDPEWLQEKNLDFKIAKHLHDNDLTLYKLIEQIETVS